MKLIAETKSEYNIKTGKFKNIDDIARALSNLERNLENELEQASAHDAKLYAEKLAENYKTFVTENSPEKGIAYDRSAIQFGYTKHGGKYYGVPNIYATHNKNGFTVGISGKDILYQEFGTGIPGKQSKYPVASARKLGMDVPYPFGEKYVIGERIIHQGKYINDSSLNMSDGEPLWYTRAIKQGIINRNNYAWMGPLGPTIGTRAGRFVYDTDDWYLREREKARYVESDIRLGKHTFTRYFKKKYFE